MTNLDRWEYTESAVQAVRKVTKLLSETRTKLNVDEVEKEMAEVRKWATAIHNRRIQLNIEMWKSRQK